MKTETKDKVTITITLERNYNGTCKAAHKIEGEGFFHYEIIGLLEVVKMGMVKASGETAKDLPTDMKIRNEYVVDPDPGPESNRTEI